VFYTLLFLLGGCAQKYPLYTNLDLTLSHQPPIFTDVSASIEGYDKRYGEEVIVYQTGSQEPIKMDNMTPVHILVTERLADALREQGLQFDNDAEKRIIVEVRELLATVTRPKFLYTAEVKTGITLRVVKIDTSLVKKYDRQATRDTPGRPDVHELENMLDEQLSDIVAQILKDEDIRQALATE